MDILNAQLKVSNDRSRGIGSSRALLHGKQVLLWDKIRVSVPLDRTRIRSLSSGLAPSARQSDDHHLRGSKSTPTFAPHVNPIYDGSITKLVAMQQRPLPSQGRHRVQLELPGRQKAENDFVVAPVGDDLLCLGRLLRQSFQFQCLSLGGRDHEQRPAQCLSVPQEKRVGMQAQSQGAMTAMHAKNSC